MKTVIAGLLCVILLAGCSSLQPYGALAGGAAFNHSSDVEPDGSIGGRVGAWADVGFDVEPGVALDVSAQFFELDGDDENVDIDRVPISPLAGARLVASEVVQPYVLLGPSAVLTSGDDSSGDLGLDVRAGVQFPNLLGKVVPFLEWRGLWSEYAPEVGGGVDVSERTFVESAKPGRGHDIGRGLGHDRDGGVDTSGGGGPARVVREKTITPRPSQDFDEWTNAVLFGFAVSF